MPVYQTPIPDWSKFQGMDAPNTTPTPDVFFDFIAPFLSDVELRVMLYLIRRTYGFKKQSDTVGIKQLTSGIVTKDGKRQDFGTQLSRAGVTKGLRGLREKNLVLAVRQCSEERGHGATEYTINFRSGGPPIDEVLRDVLGVEHSSATHVAEPLLLPVLPSATPVAPQQTVSRNRYTRVDTYDELKFHRGRYALCAVCGSRPHEADCPRAEMTP